MAAFPGTDGVVHVVRNHELSRARRSRRRSRTSPRPPAAPRRSPSAADDVSMVRLARAWPEPSGTARAERRRGEAGSRARRRCSAPRPGAPVLEKAHGYIFDVPVEGAAAREPLVAMGRFVHEAVAVDPGAASSTRPKTPARGPVSLHPHSAGPAGRRGTAGRCSPCAGVRDSTCGRSARGRSLRRPLGGHRRSRIAPTRTRGADGGGVFTQGYDGGRRRRSRASRARGTRTAGSS